MKATLAEFLNSFLLSIQRRKSVYLFAAGSIVLGVIIGLVCTFTQSEAVDVLSLSDKTFLAFVKGSGEVSAIFWDNFLGVLCASVLCAVFAISVFTLPFSLLYLAYQSCVWVLSMGSIIAKYGFSGILNSVLLIFPFNLLLLVSIAAQIGNVNSFCSYGLKNGGKLLNFDLDKYFALRFVSIFLIEFVLCLVVNVLVPLCLKSLIIVMF